MKTYSGISTERYIAVGFALCILAGGVLMKVMNELSGMSIDLIDTIFMSASAICVTGLGTVSFGQDLCGASQVTLVILIQIGGVGVMSAAAAMMLAAGRRLGFRDRLFVSGGLGLDGPKGVVRLLRHVFFYTLTFEGIGAAIMFVSMTMNGLPPLRALRHAVCLAVSAFCNAGFSLFSNNLEWFSDMYVVPGTVMLLIIIGGIGFPVMLELKDIRLSLMSRWAGRTSSHRTFLSVHSRIAIKTTAALIVFGAIGIFLAESEHAFLGMELPYKIMNSLFGSVTARTAGFDTVPYTEWSREGLIVTMILMAIGACPSSTGGGLKTTTFVIILWFTWTEMRQRENATFMGRSIPPIMLRKAAAVVLTYMTVLLAATIALAFLEENNVGVLLFEAISALSTVGLSVDVTPGLSFAGKIIIIFLMYFGRVGLLTLAATIVPPAKESGVQYPEANILI